MSLSLLSSQSKTLNVSRQSLPFAGGAAFSALQRVPFGAPENYPRRPGASTAGVSTLAGASGLSDAGRS